MTHRFSFQNIRRTLGVLVPSVALPLALVACGNLTAGGVGEARVVWSGDAPESSPNQASAEPAGGPAPASSAPAATDNDPEGEVEAEFQLYLVAEDGDLIPLTDSEVRVRVDLDGVEEPQVANRVVSAGTYTGLRIVFTEIEAEVDAGLIINGIEVTGPIDVELEGPSLTVTKSITVVIESDAVVELLVDLNAASWLEAVDPITLTVDAQLFADLVSVRVR